MQKTRLFQTLSTLEARELTAFRQFLASPYFNKREDVGLLFEWHVLHKEAKDVTKQQLWAALFPEQPYDDQQMRLLMSYLLRLLEQFLAVEQLSQDRSQIKKSVAEHFKGHDLHQLRDSALREATQFLQRQPLRDADYYRQLHQLELERYLTLMSQSPDKRRDLYQIVDSFDRAFVASKLRESVQFLSHKQIYEHEFEPGLLTAMLPFAEAKQWLSIPCIGIYVHAYRMLREPDIEHHFQDYKELLLQHGDAFSEEEIQDLYLLAINYGIRKVNAGNRRYFHDIMDLYRQGLIKGYILRNGQLSRFTYNNIVSVALQIDEADWAEAFLEEWTPILDRRYRERMYNFNRAKLAYHRQHYAEAIPLLQKANYHDLLLNLGARTLLLKIYYELDEYDALDSHLAAFQNYLRRKPDLGYHRTNYRNLIRYTRQLLHLNSAEAEKVADLRQKIQAEPILTEKQWILEQLT